MKHFTFLLFIGGILGACSSSPSKDIADNAPFSILQDSATALGDSPDHAYRLFKSSRNTLVLLRMSDMKEMYISRYAEEAPFYWTKGGKYLLAVNKSNEEGLDDETVIFDLANFTADQYKQGSLLAYDPDNDMAIIYKAAADRQLFTYFSLSNPLQETERPLYAAPGSKRPVVTLLPKDRTARVKAYSTGDVPYNFAMKY
jgi:hypothetical protein